MPALLSDVEIKARLKTVQGSRLARWQIQRQYVLGDFVKALRFVNKVGRLVEKHAHHPEIAISYDQVTLTLSTHSEGGITDLDLRLAAEIEKAAPRSARG